MKFLQFLLLALVCAVPLPAWAQERLVSPALDGFVTGFQAANAEQSILEEVPQGETVDSWTVLVTTQRFTVANAALSIFTDSFFGGLRAACPDATFTDPEHFEHFGKPALMFSADCPNSPMSGGREQMTVLAISGVEALHVKQVSFRPGYAGDTGWTRDFLLGTRVCQTDC